VDEQQWLSATDPMPMLEALRGKASDRKLRLFLADSVRALASLFGNEQEELSEIHERVADGEATEEDLERFLLRDMPGLWVHRAPGGNLPGVWESARMAVRDRFKLAPLETTETITAESRAAENDQMCAALRCVMGNPFRMRQARTFPAHVTGLAQSIYAAFPHVGPEYAILADALEELGEADAAAHCRTDLHAKGCHVVDWITGKSSS
jgi:hypothetical protein